MPTTLRLSNIRALWKGGSSTLRPTLSPSLASFSSGAVSLPVLNHHHHSTPQPSQRRQMGNWTKVRPKRIRMITFDVTGTIVSFRGSLEEHYLGAAAKYGVTDVDAKNFAKAFSKAYKETCMFHPCFGGDEMTAKEWWRECVIKSFQYAGANNMDDRTAELVFQRIYSTFGSINAYEIFPDALPFLNWARRHDIVCGIISNADERYGDSILPMLGITHDDLKFQCFSKDMGVEKPNPLVFSAAMERASPFLGSDEEPMDPCYVLHIGNDFQKDFEAARRFGEHAVLLDRYNEIELANEWRRRGAPVFRDLLDVVEFLGRSNCQLG